MAAIALIIFVAAIVWCAVFVKRYDLIGLSMLVLLAGCVFGHAFYHHSIGPIPLTVDRILFGVLAAVYVAFRYLNRVESRRWSAADLAVVLGLGILAASTLSHDWRAADAQPLATLLFFFVMPVAMYWIVRQATIQPEQVKWIFMALAGFTTYLAFTAVAEHRQWWFLVVPRYIGSPAVTEFFGRARGPFLNPVACGIYLAVGWYAGLTFWPKCSRAGKVGMMAFSGLVGLGLLCTLTRSVWLAAMMGGLLIVGLGLTRRNRLVLVACASLIAAVAIPTAWQGLSAFKRDRDVSVHDMASSARLRPVLARVAWNMFQDRPLMGCGFGQYGAESVFYLNDRTTSLPLQTARPFVQHNVFLAVLTETGIMGLAAMITIGTLWSAAAWNLWLDSSLALESRQLGLVTLAAITVYVMNGLFHDVSIMPMTNTLICVLAGAVQSVRLGGRQTPSKERVASARRSSIPTISQAVGAISKGGAAG